MTLHRRTFIQAGAATLCASAALARSQTITSAWPTKPVKLIVPFAPGGGADVATRMMANQLQTVWGNTQSAIVDNKTGGNTIIAVNALMSAPKDGHSFLVTINQTFLLPHLGQKLSFNPMADLVPVGAITMEQLVLVASPNLGAKTFDELIDKVRSTQKGTGFGTYGTGSLSHILASQIAREKKLDLVVAHYRGAAPAVQGVLTGEVGMALSNLGTVQQHVAAGRLVMIAATGTKRYRFIPDVPTFKELGITGMENPAWIGAFAPKGTAVDVIQKMGADMRKALQTPEMVQKIHGFYQEPGVMSVEAFQALVKSDDEVLGALIRSHQIRLEQ